MQKGAEIALWKASMYFEHFFTEQEPTSTWTLATHPLLLQMHAFKQSSRHATILTAVNMNACTHAVALNYSSNNFHFTRMEGNSALIIR